MNFCHLEWLIEEPVFDPEVILYEIKRYSPAEADQIIQYLFALAGFDLAKVRGDPARADRVRQAFRIIIDATREMEARRDLAEIERQNP